MIPTVREAGLPAYKDADAAWPGDAGPFIHSHTLKRILRHGRPVGGSNPPAGALPGRQRRPWPSFSFPVLGTMGAFAVMASSGPASINLKTQRR